MLFHDAVDVARFVYSHPANERRRLRAFGSAVRFQVRGRLLGKRTLTPIGRSAWMWSELHYTASSKAVYANPPDWPEMVVWASRLRARDLFIDVGANVGTYSLWAADHGAKVISVEPDAEARWRLVENAALNGFDFEVHEAALTDRGGEVTMTVGEDSRNRLVVGEAVAAASRRVATTTLDAVLGSRLAAGVKIDVEGAERLVLEGASRALEERRLLCVQLEWNECSVSLLGEDRGPVADLLRRHGYRLYRPDPQGVLVEVREPSFGPDVFALPDG